MKRAIKILCLLLFCAVLCYIYLAFGPLVYALDENKSNNVPFCGSVSEISVSDSINSGIGKTLFRANCASCHLRRSNQSMTGPGLQWTLDAWSNDTLNYLAYINNSEAYIKRENDETIKRITRQYGLDL